MNHSRNANRDFATDFVRNWIIICSIPTIGCFCYHNYLRHGIVITPLETVKLTCTLLIEHVWLFELAILFTIQHICQAYFIEKLLSLELITETKGMILHALNVFFLPTLIIICGRIGEANIVLLRLLMSYTLFTMTKTWSYAYVNSTYRSNKTEQGETIKTYQTSITLRNAFSYIGFTPPIQYKKVAVKRKFILTKKLPLLLLQIFVCYCLKTFLLVQYIFPDLQALKSQSKTFTNILICLIHVTVPMHLIWILFYYQNFYCYLTAYSIACGMDSVSFEGKWWLTTNLNAFWRNWNLPVYNCLKYNVAIPLRKSGYSLIVTNIITYTVAGIIHEFLNAFPVGIYSGVMGTLTVFEIAIGYVSEQIEKYCGRNFGNISVFSYLILMQVFGLLYLTKTY